MMILIFWRRDSAAPAHTLKLGAVVDKEYWTDGQVGGDVDKHQG